MTIKKLKDLIPGWPTNLTWVSSYSGDDTLLPDPAKAEVLEVKEHGDDLVLRVQEGARGFTATLPPLETELRRAVQATLKEAEGCTLVDAGERKVQIES